MAALLVSMLLELRMSFKLSLSCDCVLHTVELKCEISIFCSYAYLSLEVKGQRGLR